MKRTVIVLIVSLFSLVSCNTSSHYTPAGLRKLSEPEILERAINRIPKIEKTTFKDTLGNVIPNKELNKIDQEAFFGDQYVNSDNELVEVKSDRRG
jgi:hypothetical protein